MPPNRRSHRTPRYSRKGRSAALRITPRRNGAELEQTASDIAPEDSASDQPVAPDTADAIELAATTSSASDAAESSDPLDTVSTTTPDELSGDAESEDDPAEETSFLPLDSDDGEVATDTESFELEDYVQQIEAAAARERAQRKRGDGTAVRPGTDEAADKRKPKPAGRKRGPAEAAAAKKRARAEQKKKPFFKRRRTWFIIAALLPVIAGVAALLYILNIVWLGVGAYNDIHEDPIDDRVRWQVNAEGTPEPVPTADAEAVLPNWDEDEPVNIALLGVDTRVGDEDPPRSDTTIIIHVEPRTKEISMMSIPRDLMVFIPGFGDDKFNAAYPLGEVNEDDIPGGGPTLVAQTIEANFDIPIHYYATVDFDGFRKIVNTVGGVVVDVENPLSDNLYPTDDLRLTRVYFHAGLQKLDGEAALEYVRTRHADSDLGRGDRQQQVLMSIREQAISRDLISQAPDLIDNLSDTIRTDLNFNEMLALSNLGRQVNTADIARFDLWQEGLLTEHYPEFEGDAYYLEADWSSIHQAQAEFFNTKPDDTAENPDGTATTGNPNLDTPIFVENATEVKLLAGNTAQVLAEAGFTAVWPTDAEAPSPTTVIRDYTGNDSTARLVAETLGIPDGAIEPATGGNGITVVLGDDIPETLLPEAATEE